MTIDELYLSQEKKILEDFLSFLRFQSVATDPAYDEQVKACANWVEEHLKQIDFEVERWKGDGADTIFAQNLFAGPDQPTLLLYGHYDVQPIDPIELWDSPPFEPTIRDGEVYARGACDNKGQIFYTMTALRLLGKLPINVKIVIEGEEESGSNLLHKLLKEKSQELRADHLLIVDSGIYSWDAPGITIGARGIVCMELRIEEAKGDLHSGLHGGMAYNPNRALCELLASMKDAKGRITIDGFYDNIAPLSEQEKEQIDFTFKEEELSYRPTGMEEGVTPMEAATVRPTLEINGINGGYSGEGFKTVIPAHATAKVSCRLVPNQDPERIVRLFCKHVEKYSPLPCKVHVLQGDGEGFRINPNSGIARVMRASYEKVFGTPCKNILIGGTLPIAVELAKTSGADMLLVGLALPGDDVHAPNEHFGVSRLKTGCQIIADAIQSLEKRS